MKPSTEVKIGSLTLKNPVITASGTFGYGVEYSQFIDLNRLGGIVVKGLSLKPKEGNPPPKNLRNTLWNAQFNWLTKYWI